MASPLASATASTSLSPTAEESSNETKGRGLPPEDPSCPVKGMYRLLDLIMEQGNSGLGNKFFVLYHIKFVFTTSAQSIKS